MTHRPRLPGPPPPTLKHRTKMLGGLTEAPRRHRDLEEVGRDLVTNTIKVSPGKTDNYDTPIHLQITMGKALRETVNECIRSPVVSPFLIHYRPKARRKAQIEAKEHWTAVTPDYLSKSFRKARDAANAYDHMDFEERPTFHEIRALGAWLYEQQKFSKDYVQLLMGHATAEMTERYQDGHAPKEIQYVEVKADLAI